MAIRPDGRRPVAVLLVDVVAPIALYYGLRGLGVSIVAALLIGAAPPAATAITQAIRHRRMDRLAATVILALIVSTAASLLGGGPRFLLSRDGVVTAIWGLWMMLSVRAQRPLTYLFSRPLLEGRRIFDRDTRRLVRPSPQSWESLWEQEPRFRHIWRASSIIWGSALILDAALRIAMAYLLPLNTVPALNGALWPVTFVVLQVVTNVHFARSGLWVILRDGAMPATDSIRNE